MINEIIKRLQYIDALIREHNTGTASELAEIIGVSERTVYKYLKLMKMYGAPIAFNAFIKSYYYKAEGSFKCTFSPLVSSEQCLKDKPETMKLSVISISELLQLMNKNMMLHNN